MQNSTLTTSEVFVNTITRAWELQINRINNLIAEITDDTLAQEIAPEKNTGIYVLGHLVAVHDAMLPLLGFGDKLYPHLYEPFVKNPDKSGYTFPSAGELREAWKKVNDVLTKHILDLSAEGWLERHTAISEEDFAKEPHRNKLSVLISRTTHLSYHHGQLVWLKKK